MMRIWVFGFGKI